MTQNLEAIQTPQLTFYAATELTISGGAVTVTQSYHSVDTEGDAASDYLDTINGGAEGQELYIRPANGARTVVVRHDTGNIWIPGETDIELDDIEDHIKLLYSGSYWVAIGASVGSSIDAILTDDDGNVVSDDDGNVLMESPA
jgi:hypothetical protein